MARIVLALLASSLLLTACPPPQPVTPGPTPEEAEADCSSACIHYRKLGCEEGENTNDGATCEDVCENFQASGMIVMDLDCASKVTTCDAINECPVGTPE